MKLLYFCFSVLGNGYINLAFSSSLRDVTKKYIGHLWRLDLLMKIRSKQKATVREEKKLRIYDDYNWKSLYEMGSIYKLTVGDLNTYLDHNNIEKKYKLKQEKVNIINSHIGNNYETDKGTKAVQDRQIAESSESEHEVIDSSVDFSSDSESGGDSDNNLTEITHYEEYSRSRMTT